MANDKKKERTCTTCKHKYKRPNQYPCRECYTTVEGETEWVEK